MFRCLAAAALMMGVAAAGGCSQADGPEPRASAEESSVKTAAAESQTLEDQVVTDQDQAIVKPAHAEAVFAGGCFWCVEAVFEELDGVIDAVSGYTGGSAETANYKAVCTGTTGHAEAVKIIYDPSKIGYEKLLEVHLATHDPTQLNRQGADVGTQYRSAVFYADEREKAAAAAVIAKVNESGKLPRPIVTALEPRSEFYEAEIYHQNFVCNNPYQGYVQGVALPKVDKVRELFGDLLKEQSPLDE